MLVDRVCTLPKEDRNDLFALVEAMESAETEEDQDAVAGECAKSCSSKKVACNR